MRIKSYVDKMFTQVEGVEFSILVFCFLQCGFLVLPVRLHIQSNPFQKTPRSNQLIGRLNNTITLL